MQEFDVIKRLLICRKCGIIDLESRFKTDGHGNVENSCKQCDTKRSKEYRESHPEQIRNVQKRYRTSHWDKKLQDAKEWRKANPEKAKQNARKYVLARYHLTFEQYNEQLNKQDNKCYICKTLLDGKTKYTSPHIDHNHTCCNKAGYSCGDCLRGILCGVCNQFLGKIKDSVETAQRLQDYLKNAKWNPC